MKICGVAAEFNPFHNGHKYLIDTLKSDPDTGVVCVMSGNFVQRGEPAVISKFARAKAAVLCGVDLVLELPVPYSIAPAMFFAGGAMDALRALGVVDAVCFGSESGDVNGLRKIAALQQTPEFSAVLKEALKTGVTFAAAREQAVQSIAPEINPALLRDPNDILAAEYIAAADRLGMKVDLKAIRRRGAGHDSPLADGRFCSASALRENPADLKAKAGYMPPAAFSVYKQEIAACRYADWKLMERAVIAHLRTLTPEQLRTAPDVSEGLENRILLAANSCHELSTLLSAVKSKRYTHARLRRIVLASFLGVTAELQKAPLPYLRVLAMNEAGAAILSEAKGKTRVPVLSSLKEAAQISPEAARLAGLEGKAGDIYSLTLINPVAGKSDYTNRLYKTF